MRPSTANPNVMTIPCRCKQKEENKPKKREAFLIRLERSSSFTHVCQWHGQVGCLPLPRRATLLETDLSSSPLSPPLSPLPSPFFLGQLRREWCNFALAATG